MNRQLHTKELIKRFKHFSQFTIDDLHEFYKEKDPQLKRSTLRWRIFELKQKGILNSVSQGVYSINPGKKEWIPELSQFQKELFKSVRSSFPYTDFCIWSTEWLIPYAHHLPMKNLILIEPEKDALEPVYFHLRDQIDTGTVLLDPTKKEIENYLNLESTSTVVKPLISQAPIQYIEIGSEYYFVPELEKIIVDMITEKSLFQGFQGKELHTIIQNLANRYTIKNSRLRRYSQRRNRWTEVQNIVEPYLNNKSSALHD